MTEQKAADDRIAAINLAADIQMMKQQDERIRRIDVSLGLLPTGGDNGKG